MLPDRCSVTEEKRQCPNPPSFIVSIVSGRDEYMVGVACDRHRRIVAGKIRAMQKDGAIRLGEIRLAPVRAVGTDCIRGDAEDLVQIDAGMPGQAPSGRPATGMPGND